MSRPPSREATPQTESYPIGLRRADGSIRLPRKGTEAGSFSIEFNVWNPEHSGLPEGGGARRAVVKRQSQKPFVYVAWSVH